MAWNPMPQPQQRGSQASGGGAPREAVADRSAQQNDEADQQVGGGPARGIDYPASEPAQRRGDITPTPRERDDRSWDDVVQPERTETAEAERDDEPLPEGK